jgi:hypothetical protein
MARAARLGAVGNKERHEREGGHAAEHPHVGDKEARPVRVARVRVVVCVRVAVALGLAAQVGDTGGST